MMRPLKLLLILSLLAPQGLSAEELQDLIHSPGAQREAVGIKKPEVFPPAGPVPEETRYNLLDIVIRNMKVATPYGPLLFIPLIDTNKDLGLRFGMMPIWALRDKKGDGIAAVIAPSYRYNKFLKAEYTWRAYFFPNDKELIVFRASISQAVNKEVFVRYFNPQFLDTDFRLNAEIRLFRDGKFSFYGFGPDSSDANQANYSNYLIGEEFSVGIPLGAKFFADFTHTHYHYQLGNGPITTLPRLDVRFPLQAISGWKRLINHRLSLIYDSTDHPSLPRRGFLMELSAKTSQRSLGSDYTYQTYGTRFKYLYDFRQDGKFVTAANVRFEVQRGEPIPFYAQSIVGESAGLRLVGDGRFTDRGKLVFNLEERFRVARSPLLKFFSEIELSPFLDLATVFSSPGKLRLDQLKPGPGIAARILLRPQVVITLDLAILGKETNSILKVDYPF